MDVLRRCMRELQGKNVSYFYILLSMISDDETSSKDKME